MLSRLDYLENLKSNVRSVYKMALITAFTVKTETDAILYLCKKRKTLK